MKLSDCNAKLRQRIIEADCAQNPRNRKRAVVQEQEAHVRQEAGHGAQDQAVDERGCGDYRVSVTFLVSDERDRDGDGMLSTVLDCYLDAIGRLLGVDRIALRKLAKVRQGKRRRNHKN